MVLTLPCRLDTLVQDLEKCGRSVLFRSAIDGEKGRSFDLHLSDSTRVSYDKLSRKIWVEGPQKERQSLERDLILLYRRGSVVRRVWLFWSKIDPVRAWIFTRGRWAATNANRILRGTFKEAVNAILVVDGEPARKDLGVSERR